MTVADDAYRATLKLIASATLSAKTQEQEDGTRDLAPEYFLRMTGGDTDKDVSSAADPENPSEKK